MENNIPNITNITEESVTENVNEPEVSDSVVVTPTESIIGFVTGCKKLNIRKSPAVNPSNVIAVIGENTPLLIIDPEKAKREWYKVELDDGTEGFCMKEFVRVE